jgi:hypothetical protein
LMGDDGAADVLNREAPCQWRRVGGRGMRGAAGVPDLQTCVGTERRVMPMLAGTKVCVPQPCSRL